jgi:hypothetical protein
MLVGVVMAAVALAMAMTVAMTVFRILDNWRQNIAGVAGNVHFIYHSPAHPAP